MTGSGQRDDRSGTTGASSSQVAPEKIGDRVVMRDGRKGVVVAIHPEIRGAVLVEPDADLAWYMREELVLDD